MAFQYSPKVVTKNMMIYLDSYNKKSYDLSNIWKSLRLSSVTGTIFGENTLTINGLKFNGINTYVSLNTSSNYTIDDNLTFTIGFNLSSFNECGLFISGDSDGSLGFDITSTGIRFGCSPGIGNLSFISFDCDLNTNYVVTGVHDGTNKEIKLYVNGNLIGTNTISSFGSYSNLDFKMGSDNSLSGNSSSYMSGNISFLIIYNNVLDDIQIKRNYEAKKTKFLDITYPISKSSGLLTNLVAYYPFDNNTLDVHGGNDGIPINSPTYTTGIKGNAINFDTSGTERYVNVPNTADLSFADATSDLPFSMSFWVRVNAFSSTGNWIFNKRQDTTTPLIEWQIFALGGATNQLAVWLFGQGVNTNRIERYSTVNSITTGVFHHVVITYDGSATPSGIKIYIDGVDESGATTTVGTYNKMDVTASEQRFGQSGWNTLNSNKHRGLLDEFAVWKNRVLTFAEVTFLYNGGLGRDYSEL